MQRKHTLLPWELFSFLPSAPGWCIYLGKRQGWGAVPSLSFYLYPYRQQQKLGKKKKKKQAKLLNGNCIYFWWRSSNVVVVLKFLVILIVLLSHCFPTSFLIFLLFHRLVSREATVLTQTRLHVSGSSRLGNAFVIHQRPFERMPVSLTGLPWEAIRINGKTSVNKASMPVQSWFQNSLKKDLLMATQSTALDNSCAPAHFSCERKCICFHSTTEKLACVLGFLADVENGSGADDVRATICSWATAKQQVQEEHMPDSHQEKQPHGGLSGTACEVHAPLCFWHWGILTSLHQAKQIIYKLSFQLCNNS